MKVLQINSVCGIGSTGRIAADIHHILEEQGHESYIAYGRNLPRNCDQAIRIGTDVDNYLHVLKTRLFDKHGFGSKKATLKFIEQAKELNPDIIHLHNIHGYYSNIEVLFNYLKVANKPVVWTLHDCWSFTGHCANFDYIGCEKWQTECSSCPQKKTYPGSILFDRSRLNYQQKKEIFSGVNNLTIITPSKWLAELVKKSFLSEYPVEVINNGIDLDVFKPVKSDFREKYGIKDKFIVLGVASPWTERKGLQYFHDLARFLPSDEVIVLVGLNEKQIHQLPDNIIGITKTNNAHELAGIYTVADVFVNPTLEDNFPTTNLEALACGAPVITFDSGGSGETLNNPFGYLVKKGDIQLVNDTINMLKAENPNAKFIDKSSLSMLSHKYSSNQYIELYNRFLE